MLQVILALLIALSSSQTATKAHEVREANNDIKQVKVVEQPVKSEVKKEVEKQPQQKTETKPKTQQVKADTYKWDYATLTAYSNHYRSTGKNPGDKGYGITKSGRPTVEGRTVAADPRKYPLGTKLYIEGVGNRIVEDIGGDIEGNRIDVYFKSEKDALEFGRKRNVRVRVVSYPNKYSEVIINE